MTTMLTCPDDLLVAARTRGLGPEDRARLAAHLARCAACRATLDVGLAFDAELGARPGDDEIARRIAARIAPGQRRRRLPYLLAAGLVFVTGTVAAAKSVPAVWNVVTWDVAEDQPDAPPAKVAPPVLHEVLRGARGAAQAERVRGVSEPLPAPLPDPSLAPSAPAVAAAPRGAAELFALGNASRRRGENDAARRAYEELMRLYPSSVEALVSHVSLGRLERGASPSSALRHFNAYLSQSAHTTLAEEALFGKASTLLALGRSAEERATWQELLRRFPGSVYAERARARLSPAPVE